MFGYTLSLNLILCVRSIFSFYNSAGLIGQLNLIYKSLSFYKEIKEAKYKGKKAKQAKLGAVTLNQSTTTEVVNLVSLN